MKTLYNILENIFDIDQLDDAIRKDADKVKMKELFSGWHDHVKIYGDTIEVSGTISTEIYVRLDGLKKYAIKKIICPGGVNIKTGTQSMIDGLEIDAPTIQSSYGKKITFKNCIFKCNWISLHDHRLINTKFIGDPASHYYLDIVLNNKNCKGCIVDMAYIQMSDVYCFSNEPNDIKTFGLYHIQNGEFKRSEKSFYDDNAKYWESINPVDYFQLNSNVVKEITFTRGAWGPRIVFYKQNLPNVDYEVGPIKFGGGWKAIIYTK